MSIIDESTLSCVSAEKTWFLGSFFIKETLNLAHYKEGFFLSFVLILSEESA